MEVLRCNRDVMEYLEDDTTVFENHWKVLRRTENLRHSNTQGPETNGYFKR